MVLSLFYRYSISCESCIQFDSLPPVHILCDSRRAQVEEFVQQCLANADAGLTLLPESKMAEALENFIKKEDSKAIRDQVAAVLDEVQGELFLYFILFYLPLRAVRILLTI